MTHASIVIVTTAVLATQGVPPAPPAPPVPPVAVYTSTARPLASNQQQLVRWLPGDVRCAGAAVSPITLRRPYSTLRYPNAAIPTPPVTLSFDIDDSGRPLSIDRVDGTSGYLSADLPAAFAASRFPANAPRKGCTIGYQPTPTPIAEVPIEDLYSYSLTPQGGRLPEAGWDRIRAAGDCTKDPRLQPLVTRAPDLRTLPGTPGVPDWAMLLHDVDAGGRPTNVRVVSTTGNAALDTAAIRAMREWRFAGGPRTGCANPFRRNAAVLPAPPIPADLPKQDDATCPPGRDWAQPPRLVFPEPFGRRAIEGWAVIRYDVAPWGEPGNLTVVAAQPSADFGRQAMTVIRSARLKPSDRSRTGCIDRVRFVMPGTDGAALDRAS